MNIKLAVMHLARVILERGLWYLVTVSLCTVPNAVMGITMSVCVLVWLGPCYNDGWL